MATTTRAARGGPRCYLTVSVPFIPMAKCPGKVHTNR